MSSSRALRVAMVGHGFMGAAHSHAWRTAPHFFDLPVRIEMSAVGGRDGDQARLAAARLGWDDGSEGWRSLVAREDIDLIDICVPSDAHAEVAVAALEAGKHVLCEKPLANTVAEAERMAAAAVQASAHDVFAMAGFTYRRVPAVQLMRQLVLGGDIGEVRHARASYLQDWLADPAAPMSWRLERDRAGSGALGDLGSHIVDAVQFVTGRRVERVVGRMETFVPRRPNPASNDGFGRVTVDDATIALADLGGGALATFEATRVASGRKNGLRLEINGTTGSVAFDLEDLNSLQLHRSRDGWTSGFRRVLVTEREHPYVAAWWPPGHLLGYEHAFTHQVVDLVDAIVNGRQPRPSFEDALQVQHVLHAIESSATRGEWVEVVHPVIT